MPLTLRVRQVVALVAVDREAELALVAVEVCFVGYEGQVRVRTSGGGANPKRMNGLDG
jgi:hypothetical protein